jgi:hypothetical protein
MTTKNSSDLSRLFGNYQLPYWFFQINKREISPAPGHATSRILAPVVYCLAKLARH